MLGNLKERTWVNWGTIEGLLRPLNHETQIVFGNFLRSLYGEDAVEDSVEDRATTKKRGRGVKSITNDLNLVKFQSFATKLAEEIDFEEGEEVIFMEAAECAWAAEQLHKVLNLTGRKGNRFQPSSNN